MTIVDAIPAVDSPRALLRRAVAERDTAAESYALANAVGIARCAAEMADRFFDGATLLVLAWGAGATDAEHNAVEYVHPVLPGCRALPAISLASDAATLSGLLVGPDPAATFALQVEALGRPGDIALALGEAPPGGAIERGLAAARRRGLLTVALLGEGPAGAGLADHVFVAAVGDPLIARELHLATYHVLWELVHIVLNHRGIAAQEPA